MVSKGNTDVIVFCPSRKNIAPSFDVLFTTKGGLTAAEIEAHAREEERARRRMQRHMQGDHGYYDEEEDGMVDAPKSGSVIYLHPTSFKNNKGVEKKNSNLARGALRQSAKLLQRVSGWRSDVRGGGGEGGAAKVSASLTFGPHARGLERKQPGQVIWVEKATVRFSLLMMLCFRLKQSMSRTFLERCKGNIRGSMCHI